VRHDFAGDEPRIAAALDGYRGLFPSIDEYIASCLESDGIPEWLIPYVDLTAIGHDWSLGGALWTLPERSSDDATASPSDVSPRGVHIFIS
jgi:hypothetical protein